MRLKGYKSYIPRFVICFVNNSFRTFSAYSATRLDKAKETNKLICMCITWTSLP